jgi:LmbE family N-acetylglucosaminyl deacetylase
MRFTFERDRVLAVMAHPDDAELLCAGTLARAKADGAAAVGICVMCTGDKGVAAGETGGDDAAQRRRHEAASAAKLLGAELLWFGCPDGELFDTTDNRRRLIELYRQFRPTLVLAHSAIDYHPDHRAASQIAEAASWFCASRGHVTASPPLDAPPAVWWCDVVNAAGFQPAIYVDVSAHLDLKVQMLRCHNSQLRRGADADFAPLEALMRRQASTRGAEAQVAAAEGFVPHKSFKRARAW